MVDEENKKIIIYEFEKEEFLNKLKAMSSKKIYEAKCEAYEGYAGNEEEGDYGTWTDWQLLFFSFCEDLINEFVEVKK